MIDISLLTIDDIAKAQEIKASHKQRHTEKIEAVAWEDGRLSWQIVRSDEQLLWGFTVKSWSAGNFHKLGMYKCVTPTSEHLDILFDKVNSSDGTLSVIVDGKEYGTRG
jgi:hypothetical protein